MYKTHPNIQGPTDSNQIIWRYQDLAKFMQLIHSSSLYFSRSDMLGDPFEGSVSQMTKEDRQYIAKTLKMRGVNNADNIPGQLMEGLIAARRDTFINCWHMNVNESAAMWSLYGKDSYAIAVQSKSNLLIESLKYSETDIYVGVVNYVDYDNTLIPEDNHFYPFLHKRISFQHEKELRALIWVNKVRQKTENIPDSHEPLGLNVQIDLNILIEKIYISPLAPDWFVHMVIEILKKYNVNKPVIFSHLGNDPIF